VSGQRNSTEPAVAEGLGPLAPIAGGTGLITGDSQDAHFIGLWLHGRRKHTRRSYEHEVAGFCAYVQRPLRTVTLALLQEWSDQLVGEPSTRAHAIAAVKSLYKFFHQLGYLPVDVGVPLRTPGQKDTLAERILPEADIRKILRAEKQPRNAVMLKLLYASGIRVSELCGLTWADCVARDGGRGQLAVFGKRDKTRFILLEKAVWSALMSLRPAEVEHTAPVFRSRVKGGHLDPSQVLRIVKAAAARAGIDAGRAVSPHWFRHAHASHAIDHGASLVLVRDTLGHGSLATTNRYTHARPGESSGSFLKT
jgi:site-specific recombinase XerD